MTCFSRPRTHSSSRIGFQLSTAYGQMQPLDEFHENLNEQPLQQDPHVIQQRVAELVKDDDEEEARTQSPLRWEHHACTLSMHGCFVPGMLTLAVSCKHAGIHLAWQTYCPCTAAHCPQRSFLSTRGAWPGTSGMVVRSTAEGVLQEMDGVLCSLKQWQERHAKEMVRTCVLAVPASPSAAIAAMRTRLSTQI